MFLDGQDIGDRFFLETIRPDDVVELRFVGGIDASVRFGAQYGLGVIEVSTR